MPIVALRRATICLLAVPPPSEAGQTAEPFPYANICLCFMVTLCGRVSPRAQPSLQDCRLEINLRSPFNQPTYQLASVPIDSEQ